MSKITRSSFALRSLLLLAAFGTFACAKDHDLDKVNNPADPGSSDLLAPTPLRVNAILSNRSVLLTWELGDSSLVSRVDRYRVYRIESATRVLEDSTDAPPLIVTGLDNGTPYRFQITSVLDTGLESRPSNGITASPATFGVVIEAARVATNSTRVGLTFQAPSGTQGLRVSNTPDLESIPLQPFTGSQTWELAPGDGTKTVYVQFTDALGNASEKVFDQIELDTRAEISSVSFTPNEAEPGDIVHLRVDAGETGGTATARLGEAGAFVTLRDDGLDGDPTADDGVYERDYVLEQTIELFEELVIGNFTDQAGNQAESRLAPGRLTVHLDPEPVVLATPTSPSPQEIELRWTQAPDGARFRGYRVYRDDAPGVANSPTRRQVHEQFSRAQTTFTDTGLDPTKTYYYVVEVIDDLGNGAPSNEVSARPRDNETPDAVLLGAPTEVSETSITIAWSRSFDDDFKEYRVYRGFQPNLDTDPERRQLASLRDADENRLVDREEIEENRTYYYRVDVIDQLGAATPSNVVNATTPDRLPPAVTLNQPSSVGETSVLLEWAESLVLDFARYDIRRAEQPGVSETSTLVLSITDQERTSHLDTGRRENTDYYYRLFVVDRGGHATGSNEISVTTRNADPAAVTLAAPTEQTSAPTPTVVLAWSQSAAHDFERYRIFRDTAPAVSDASTLVRAIFQANVTTFTDQDLEDNRRYYYRVFVEDEADGATGSNEQSIVTVNRAPTPVVLSVSATTPNSITLSWTQNTDHDFDQYRLLQGTTDSSFPIVAAELNSAAQTGHTVFVPTNDPTVHFFKLVVYDQDIDSSQRLTSDSNIVSAQATPASN